MLHPINKLPQPTAVLQPAILIAGVSDVYIGKHYLCANGTFLPARGGFGDLSHAYCVKQFRRFESVEKAEEWIADYRLKWPKSVFTALSVERTDERLINRQTGHIGSKQLQSAPAR